MKRRQVKGFFERLLDPFFLPLAHILESAESKRRRLDKQKRLASIPESRGLVYCREHAVGDYVVRFGPVTTVIVHKGMPIAYVKVRDLDMSLDEYRLSCRLVRQVRDTHIERIG